MANKIFVKRGRQRLLTQFKHDSLYVFHTGIRLQNFLNGVASANVNSWVESKTNHHITNLFSADDFDKYTRVVLVNAVYFKGTWKEKFNKALTTSRPFYTSSGTEVQVPNMQIMSKFRYIRDWQHDIELLELPFEGDDMSMVLVLPSQVDSLPALQAKLATELNIQDLIANMLTESISVSIPKFKIETSVDLIKVLQKIGVNLIFDADNSQLTKVTPKRLYITKAMQKAFIEVNEDGAEVTAATGIINLKQTKKQCNTLCITFGTRYERMKREMYSKRSTTQLKK